MTARRVACVIPSFWPAVGQTQSALIDLTDVLQAAGHRVTIFTAKLESDWSTRLQFRETSVIRIERPIPRPWSKNRYARSLVRAVQRDSEHWDAVLIFGAGEELIGLAQVAAEITPRLLLRLDHQFVTLCGEGSPPSRIVDAMRACQQIYCNCPPIRQTLLAQNFSPRHVHYATDGVNPLRLPQRQTATWRDTARESLAELHPFLSVERMQPFVVSARPMFGDSGLFDLVEAWRKVRRVLPRAVLALIGDGPQAKSLWNRVSQLNLQGSVVLPGWIDDWDDFLLAADVYVHPSREELACPVLNRALAMGLCCVTTASCQGEYRLTNEREVMVVPPGREDCLATAILKALRDDASRARMGSAARASMLSPGGTTMASSILGLIEQPAVAVFG